MNNALAAVAAIFLAVVGPASAQLCKDDNQDCCAYTATGDQGASSLNCDQLISESSVTWSGTASQSLVCRNDDAAASSRCSWITPAGKTCTFEKLGNQDVSEDCGDPAINFTGDLSGNTGLCQITVSTPSKEDHEGLWTCKYQNYRDTITVEVKKSGSGSGSESMPTSTVLAITIPICLIAILIIVLVLMFCLCPAALAACWAAVCCCCRKKEDDQHSQQQQQQQNWEQQERVQERHQRSGFDARRSSSSSSDSSFRGGPPRVIVQQIPSQHQKSGAYPPPGVRNHYDISEGTEEEFSTTSNGYSYNNNPKGESDYEAVIYSQAQPSQPQLQIQPKTARKISNTNSMHSTFASQQQPHPQQRN